MTSEWRFSQCFGDKGNLDEVTEADIISTLEFDQTGRYLASGDKGGRVVLFEREESKKGCQYRFWTEFQSHEPEFDYLKSVEIDEKINKVKWIPRSNAAHFLLSTNDKTVKLWKVYEKQIRSASTARKGADGLHMPTLTSQERVFMHLPKRVFANAHAYHINSISVNCDSETFISADDLRINLWSLENTVQSFNIVDIKPPNMEDLTEVITSAEFHPTHCNYLLYSSSKGTIKLCDMRQQALCDRHAKLFQDEEDPSKKSYFSEIISSISDVKFSRDGRYILSRDYLTAKIWDLAMDNKPVATFKVHEHLRSKLTDLYENDCIFDKFECNFSGNGQQILTGSYNNSFHIFDKNTSADITLEASKSVFKKKSDSLKSKLSLGKKKKDESRTDGLDFNKKILHAVWHPQENSIAVAATNNLFIFTQQA